jgi:hypothetical protein
MLCKSSIWALGASGTSFGSWAVVNCLPYTHEPASPQVKSHSSDPLGAERRTKVMPMK